MKVQPATGSKTGKISLEGLCLEFQPVPVLALGLSLSHSIAAFATLQGYVAVENRQRLQCSQWEHPYVSESSLPGWDVGGKQ